MENFAQGRFGPLKELQSVLRDAGIDARIVRPPDSGDPNA